MHSNVTFFLFFLKIDYANLIVLILWFVDPRCQLMIFQALLVLYNWPSSCVNVCKLLLHIYLLGYVTFLTELPVLAEDNFLTM